MSPTEIAAAFREGRFIDADGPLVPRRAVLTRKSLLLYTDDRVLKLKRPRHIDGYDASLISVRYAMVARERWIGRQINTRCYLPDVVLRPRADGAVQLHPGLIEGEAVAMMRRMADGLRADAMLVPGMDADTARALLEPLMLRIARFHIAGEAHDAPPFGDPARPRARFDEVMAALAPTLEPAVERHLRDETGAWLDALAPTFARRVRERRVRTTHGELRLEHVFLPRADVVIIDPNDGPDADRAIDTAEDLMNLVIELDAILGVAAASSVVAIYARTLVDVTLERVARFYKRLACLRRAVEAHLEAAEPEADVALHEARARWFVARSLAV